MTPEILLERLRQIQFLQDIDEEYLKELSAMTREVEYPAGKVIFREGQPLTDIYLLVTGSVALEICAPGLGCKRIMTLTDGDLLGISPLLDELRSTATARTLTPVRALVLNGGQVLTLCEHNPRFGFEIMRRSALAISKRLSAARLQLLDVFGPRDSGTAEEGSAPGGKA